MTQLLNRKQMEEDIPRIRYYHLFDLVCVYLVVLLNRNSNGETKRMESVVFSTPVSGEGGAFSVFHFFYYYYFFFSLFLLSHFALMICTWYKYDHMMYKYDHMMYKYDHMILYSRYTS